MNTCGLGHDVVDVAAFAEQLAEPGSRMRALFSVREVRQASDRARQKNDGEAVHLAAKWAGKEAFLKAWCDYLGDAPYPFTLDNFPWPEIEILDDSRGVPHVSLGKGAASVFQTDYANSAAGARYSSAYSSASDNGPYAVMQERRNARSAAALDYRCGVDAAYPYFPEPRWFDCLRGGDDFCGIAPEAPECYMLYNVSIMVNLWGALTSRDVRLLKNQIDKLDSLPENCWFVILNAMGADLQPYESQLIHL